MESTPVLFVFHKKGWYVKSNYIVLSPLRRVQKNVVALFF